MRLQFIAAAALSVIAIPVLAQTAVAPAAAPAPAPTILYASPADAAAVLAKAKSLPAMAPQFLVASGGYSARIEHRKVSTPGSVHEKEDEFLEVVDGAGTITVGGTLKNPVRRDENNMAGSGIDGGTTYQVTKGSYFLFPAGVAHYFVPMGPDGLTILTFHVPHKG